MCYLQLRRRLKHSSETPAGCCGCGWLRNLARRFATVGLCGLIDEQQRRALPGGRGAYPFANTFLRKQDTDKLGVLSVTATFRDANRDDPICFVGC